MAPAPTRPPSGREKTASYPTRPLHYVTKHLQQRIESDHFRVKKNDAADRRFSILSHGPTDNPGVRSHAVAAQRVRVCRRLDGQGAEPAAVGLFRAPPGEQSLKREPVLAHRAAEGEPKWWSEPFVALFVYLFYASRFYFNNWLYLPEFIMKQFLKKNG